MILCSVDAPHILFSLCIWDGIGVFDRVSVVAQHTPPLGIQFLSFFARLSCRRKLPMLFTVPQPEAHLYGTPRPIPDLSGLVRSPRARFPGMHLCCCHVLTAHAVHSLFPAIGNPRARPEGSTVLEFPAVMELMELILDCVLVIFED